ncbi:MAG: TetR/AcrR family transcriptional regulator [Spirochaetales bacterium]|nr:TetR/AcrR family transcriptional regulator [Spirochaetales bacterium]
MGNREETETRILEGVDRLIREKGFSSLGINAVARESGVSKVLIYRYFENRDGLLRTWALGKHYWNDAPGGAPSGEGVPWQERATALFEGQLDRLFGNPLLREVIRWHLSSDDPLSRDVMDRIEEKGKGLTQEFSDNLDTQEDVNAFVSLLIGGIYYLALISDKTDQFNGIPLKSDEGRTRLRDGVTRLCGLIFGEMTKKGP